MVLGQWAIGNGSQQIVNRQIVNCQITNNQSLISNHQSHFHLTLKNYNNESNHNTYPVEFNHADWNTR